MIEIRPGNERGHEQRPWLESYHTFSFADYFDPQQMGFRMLRVINEDWIQAGNGFGMHFHENMEIITYVLEGVLAHRDDLGASLELHGGDVQCMTAGSGITHSEVNPSTREMVHLLQIWILPEIAGLPPGYTQRHFPAAEKQDSLRLIASHDGRDGSLRIHQDAALYACVLGTGKQIAYLLPVGRYAWVQVARGAIRVNGQALQAGDGAAVADEIELMIAAEAPAEFLLFDLA